jgi:hypothetical protein
VRVDARQVIGTADGGALVRADPVAGRQVRLTGA